MTRSRNLAIIAATVLLTACAGPSMDSSASTFDESKIAVDLGNCRGGTVLDVALRGFGGVVIGSAYGAFNGSYLGAISGHSPEGAIVGAVVGGVFGVVSGAYEPIQEQEQSVHVV